jgi:hypothetical protein
MALLNDHRHGALDSSDGGAMVLLETRPGRAYALSSERGGLIAINNGCFKQAWFNRDHFYAGLNLRPVMGSLGIGQGDPFYEYGGLAYRSLADFIENGKDGSWDVHMWLEDEEGNVFDIVTPLMEDAARINKKQLSQLSSLSRVEGLTKAWLRDRGLHYVAVPDRRVHDALVKLAMMKYGPVYERERSIIRAFCQSSHIYYVPSFRSSKVARVLANPESKSEGSEKA